MMDLTEKSEAELQYIVEQCVGERNLGDLLLGATEELLRRAEKKIAELEADRQTWSALDWLYVITGMDTGSMRETRVRRL